MIWATLSLIDPNQSICMVEYDDGKGKSAHKSVSYEQVREWNPGIEFRFIEQPLEPPGPQSEPSPS